MCGEDIPHDATVCRYCGEELDPPEMAGGLWRDGGTLVMEKTAVLPDRCVKSNQPTRRTLKRKLSWHHPALFLTIFLCGLIPYVIIALIVRKTATVHIGLSDEWFAKRRRATIIGWLLVLVGVVLFVAGFSIDDKKGNVAAPLILFGLVFGLLAAIFGLLAARMVFPKRITDRHVWINGVCREYLETLPPWDDRRG